MYVFKATQLDLESGLALYPQVSAQFDIQVLRLNRSICHIHERISDSFSRSLTSHFFLKMHIKVIHHLTQIGKDAFYKMTYLV